LSFFGALRLSVIMRARTTHDNYRNGGGQQYMNKFTHEISPDLSERFELVTEFASGETIVMLTPLA
jgi:hypothetical protein